MRREQTSDTRSGDYTKTGSTIMESQAEFTKRLGESQMRNATARRKEPNAGVDKFEREFTDRGRGVGGDAEAGRHSQKPMLLQLPADWVSFEPPLRRDLFPRVRFVSEMRLVDAVTGRAVVFLICAQSGVATG